MDNNVNYVPQVDYTSRDYAAIREDLLSVIPTFAPAWVSRDPADLGMTLVELFAYMGDLLNFYIDRAANEGFLATASQRDSILRIAAMLGYTPTTSSAATAELTFTNTTDELIEIPALTQIATTTIVDGLSTQIIFETDSLLQVGAAVDGVATSASVMATQGVTITDEVLGTSTGAPSQVFKLSESPVIQGTISVKVNGIQYTYSSSLIENGIYDPVFTTLNDAQGETYIIFGDGIGGRIPPTSGQITATYRVGNGAAGNVEANTLREILTNQAAGLTVTNQETAVGGADEESTESIRINAPLALRSLRRAVSLKDYGSLALQVSGVAKAIAESSSFNSVNLYIAPFGDTGVYATAGVGYSAGDPTPSFNSLAQKTGLYFIDKVAPNVSLTVLPPTYVPIDIDITVHILPQYRQDVVLPQAEAAVRELVALANSRFADVIPTQFIVNAISAVPGVDYSTVDYLRRQSSLQSYALSAWSRASNIMTVTSATHTLTVGQVVHITSSNSEVSGTHTVLSVPNNTSFTFGTTTAGTASGSLSSTTARAIVVETIECAVNEIPSAGIITLTATGGIA